MRSERTCTTPLKETMTSTNPGFASKLACGPIITCDCFHGTAGPVQHIKHMAHIGSANTDVKYERSENGFATNTKDTNIIHTYKTHNFATHTYTTHTQHIHTHIKKHKFAKQTYTNYIPHIYTTVQRNNTHKTAKHNYTHISNHTYTTHIQNTYNIYHTCQDI